MFQYNINNNWLSWLSWLVVENKQQHSNQLKVSKLFSWVHHLPTQVATTPLSVNSKGSLVPLVLMSNGIYHQHHIRTPSSEPVVV